MPNIIDLLAEAGVADRRTIERVAEEVEGSTVSLGEALVHETGVDERDVYVILAEAFGRDPGFKGAADPSRPRTLPS